MSKEIKLVYKYFAKDIAQQEWKKEYMLFDGWSGYKVYSPSGMLIGKSINKGTAMDMARAHYKWSTGKDTPVEKDYIKFFKDNFVAKEGDQENVSRETFNELELRTAEEEKLEKVRLSKLFRKELQKNG